MAATLDVVVCTGTPRNEIVGIVQNGPGNPNDATVLCKDLPPTNPVITTHLLVKSFYDSIRASTPICWWRMDETTGRIGIDSIAAYNVNLQSAVVINQPGLIAGSPASMLFPGGTNSSATAIANGNFPAVMTFEIWLKSSDTVTSGNQRPILSTRSATIPGGGYFGTTNGKPFYYQDANGANPAGVCYGTKPVVDTLRHQIVFVLTASICQIYVDGVLDTTTACARLGTTSPFYMGWDAPNAAEYWKGILDEVVLYYRALPAAEILDHYQTGLAQVGKVNDTYSFPMQVPGKYFIQYKRQDTGQVYDTEYFEIKSDPTVCLEMEFIGKNNGWTIVRDWNISQGLSWHRGLPGVTLLDLIADIGTLNFTLDNSEINSAKKVGYYSPDHANKRYGFFLNIGVRVRMGTVVRFSGVMSAIDPVPGKWGPRTVSCEVTDWMGIADRTRLEDLPVLVNKRGDEVFQTLIDSLPSSAKPNSVQKDISPDTYPYTLDRTRDEQTVLRDELYRLCTSGLARIYLIGDGTLVYEVRGTRATKTSNVDNFVDHSGFGATHDRATVINRAQATIHPRLPSTVDVVMYSMPQAMLLQPGITITILGPWTDPANPSTRVGAVSLVSLVAGTDYVANAAANGSGADLTGSLSVVVGLSGNATSFDITLPQGGYLTKLQQRGKPLYDYGSAVLSWEDPNSIAQFGVTSQQVDMPYTADAALALEVVQFAVFNGAYPLTNITGFTRVVDLKNTAEIQRSISRQVSDRIGITDPVTGLSKPFFINAVEEVVMEGRLQTKWLLVPADVTGYWLLEVDGYTELSVTTRLGFGQILGHTDIAHSDFHNDAVHIDTPHYDSHTDVVHQDILHGDAPGVHGDDAHYDQPHYDTYHTDVPVGNTHVDTVHSDQAHQDYHTDQGHGDQGHGDAHDDQVRNTPYYYFGDHSDCTCHNDKPPLGAYYSQLNCWSQSMVGGPGRPGGQLHFDQYHVDGGGFTPFPHYDDVYHVDTQHDDYHGDGHTDSHQDQPHGDSVTNTPHGDTPHDDYHQDWPHQDIAHVDYPFYDVPHTDSYGHYDSPHTDVIHQDVAHQDALHYDTAHLDAHGDFHGDLN